MSAGSAEVTSSGGAGFAGAGAQSTTSGALTLHTRFEPPTQITLLADPTLAEADVEAVFGCFLGRPPRRRMLDGTRSLVIRNTNSGVHDGIKIKGAGLRGSRVRLGELHAKPYGLPRYDFEGAATVDAAKDHGRAFAGGMSYQQACQEFAVSRHLSERGVQVLPALGYGVLRRNGLASWFCLIGTRFGEQLDWWRLTRQRASVARVAERFGQSQLELAEHAVFLALSGMVEVAGDLFRKDFHTAHIAGPNDSFLTRLSLFLFDTNFVLAHFGLDGYVPDIADHRELARVTYIRALTGREFPPHEIDRFKSLLVESKFATWTMEERLARLASDPIGCVILDDFLRESGQEDLFNELPPAAPIPADAGTARQRRGFGVGRRR